MSLSWKEPASESAIQHEAGEGECVQIGSLTVEQRARVSKTLELWQFIIDTRETLKEHDGDAHGDAEWAQRELDEIDAALAALPIPRALEAVRIKAKANLAVMAYEILLDCLPRLAKGECTVASLLDEGDALSDEHFEAFGVDTFNFRSLLEHCKLEDAEGDWNNDGKRRVEAMASVLMDDSADGPLGVLAADGPVEAAAVAVDLLGICPRSTLHRYRKASK